MVVKLKTTPASNTWGSVITAFSRVNRVLGDEMQEETGVSLDWYGILLMLSQADHGTLRPSDLADNVALSRSATTRLIDRMEKEGLVERRACATDRRGTFVGLTDHGEEVFRRAGRVHLRGIDEHFGSHLSPSELKQLTGLLDQVSKAVGGPTPLADPPD